MAKPDDNETAKSDRASRLADELKANLARRKAQTRQRGADRPTAKAAPDEES